MIIKSITKNPDTGEFEAYVRLTYEDVDYIKGCVSLVKSHKLMDDDDSEKQELNEHLKDTLLDIKGKLRP